MNSRNNSQRLQQWQLAERQRYLTELEALGGKLQVDVEQLRGEIERAGGDGTAAASGPTDPLSIRPLIDRREKLQRSIVEIDAQLIEARAAVAAALRETKLVEGAVAQRGFSFEDRLTRRARRST